jgi:hypothetical protein
MTSPHSDVIPATRRDQGPRSSPPTIVPVLLAAEGVALAVMLALDGSAVWRVAKVLVVIAVTAVAAWSACRAGRVGRGVIMLAGEIAGTATSAPS